MLSICAARRACGTVAVLTGLAALTLAGLLTDPVLAHVIAQPNTAVAGSVFNAGFMVGHGCDGSPTVALRVTIPDGVTAVTPQEKPGWKLTQAAGEVEWRGGPLPANVHESFTIAMTLPDRPGRTLYFPTVQECQQGIRPWSEIPAAGQSRKDLHAPAPFVTLEPKSP